MQDAECDGIVVERYLSGAAVMHIHSYILKDKIAYPCGDIATWAEWMARNDRTVAKTHYDNIEISTVFLGLDHGVGRNGDPLLFETMVFEDQDCSDPVVFSQADGTSFAGYNRRYSFYADAEEGHREICAEIKERIDKAKERASAVSYGLVVSQELDINSGKKASYCFP